MELKEADSLSSDYTKNQKQRYISMEQDEKPEINLCNFGQSTTREARLYNGGKTVSSINGARKTEQLHVK